MTIRSLFIVSAITTALALPAMGQQSTSMHRYAILFKYTNQAVKANPCPIVFTAREALLMTPSVAFANE
jgi:hypothetical protein